MLINKDDAKSLELLFKKIKLRKSVYTAEDDQEVKIKQILSYLEVIDAQIRKMSKKRKLVILDSAAGNCYLSFLVYHYYSVIGKRDIEIHCIDINKRLMDNSREIAQSLSFRDMHFHSSDILEFSMKGEVDLSYSLHACDSATDKALYLGIRMNARCILSVSCCQHSLNKVFRNQALKGVSRYKSFKTRLLYIISDTMRAHLLEMSGYKVDIFDFTSSRNTDKNVMIRARKGNFKSNPQIQDEYRSLFRGFNIKPELEGFLQESPQLRDCFFT